MLPPLRRPFLTVLMVVVMAHGLLIAMLGFLHDKPTPVEITDPRAPTPKVQTVRMLAVPEVAQGKEKSAAVAMADVTLPQPKAAPIGSPLAPEVKTTSAIFSAAEGALGAAPPEIGPGTSKGTTPAVEGRAASGKAEGGVSSTGTADAIRAGSGAVVPDAPPQYLYNPKPVYPRLSKKLQEEGKVVLRVWVGIDGQPAKAELATSSGYEGLNAAALSAVMGWRFTPGRRNGQAQAMEVLVTMPFRLE